MFVYNYLLLKREARVTRRTILIATENRSPRANSGASSRTHLLKVPNTFNTAILVNKLLTHEPSMDKLCTNYSNIGDKEVVSSTYSVAVWECRKENGTKSKIEFYFMLRGQITID